MVQGSEVATYQNYIGGRWVESSSGRTYTITNPAHKGTVLGEFQASVAEDASQAIDAASAALAAWSSTPAPQRASVLYQAWEIMRERQDDIARTITLEEGKALPDAQGEVKRAMNITEYAAGEGRRLFGYTTPSELPDTVAYTTRRPVGVVGIITPWNFPIAIPAWKIAPALICGNTLVFKPASATPMSAVKLVKVFEDAGLPAGVLNLITGPGALVGNALVNDPRVKGISFTGSTEIGSGIYTEGAKGSQESAVRDGWEERCDSPLRRRHGQDPWRHRPGGLRLYRPTVHRHQPSHRRGGHIRALHGTADRAHQQAQDRRRDGIGDRRKSSIESVPVRQGPGIHRHRRRGGRQARLWGQGAHWARLR